MSPILKVLSALSVCGCAVVVWSAIDGVLTANTVDTILAHETGTPHTHADEIEPARVKTAPNGQEYYGPAYWTHLAHTMRDEC